MILKIFSPKNSGKKLAFLTQTKAKLCKILITLIFEKNANFFAENCRKSQKFVIITSTPGPVSRVVKRPFLSPLYEINSKRMSTHTDVHSSTSDFFC
jgi:hypothetical protein